MAGKRRTFEDRRAARVQRRKPRPGPKRTVNVTLPCELAAWLEHRAVDGLTTPSEIVGDFIESARKMSEAAREREARRRPGDAASAGASEDVACDV